MPYELFWNGEPNLVKAYLKTHELRNQQRNQEMWVQGIYNFRAFKAVAESLAYGLAGGKGAKPSPYPEAPIPFTESEEKAATERNKQKTLQWVESNQH